MRKFTPDHLSIQVLRKLNLATWRGRLRETCIKKIRVRAEQPQSELNSPSLSLEKVVERKVRAQ